MEQKKLISESELRYIVSEAVAEALEAVPQYLLFEAYLSEIASLKDVHEKYYSGIPYDDFDLIVHMDPTSGPDKMGKYSKWLLVMYQKNAFTPQNFLKVKQYLEFYNKFINRIEKKDINQIKSVEELKSIVKPFMDNSNQPTSKTMALKTMKLKEAMKVYEDDRWLVIVPFTKEAAMEYGKHTKWCTSGREDNRFDRYVRERGNLYIMVDKAENKKYQFQPSTWEFNNEKNESADINNIDGATPGLIDFIDHELFRMDKDITLKREAYWNAIINRRLKAGEDLWSIFSIVSKDYDGIRAVKYNGKINFISNDNRILSPVWFDEAKCIRNGYFDVWKDGFGINLVNKKGELALPYWSEIINDFNNGIATYYVRNKGWNYFREDGKVLLDNYAFRCHDFTGDTARVKMTADAPFRTIDKDGKFVKTSDDSLYYRWS